MASGAIAYREQARQVTMMDSMVRYSTAMLQAVADFLATEPIIYLFAIACMACIIKVFRALLP